MCSFKHPVLAEACFEYPAIDNHAHNVGLAPSCLMSASGQVNTLAPLASIYSEAAGAALTEHAHTSLPGLLALRQLGAFYGLPLGTPWDALEAHLNALDWNERCTRCFKAAKIQGLLLDDLLPGVKEKCEVLEEHAKWIGETPKRLVRIEEVAEGAVKKELNTYVPSAMPVERLQSAQALAHCTAVFEEQLQGAISDPVVVGFKSVVCYRAGLDVDPSTARLDICPTTGGEPATTPLLAAWEQLQDGWVNGRQCRLNSRLLNDWFLGRALGVIRGNPREGRVLPIQFHTGLGDNDLLLTHASPSHLQPLIRAYPSVPMVILHASYPFTREAGYLASVYHNVYLDLGEVWPMVGREGLRRIVHQAVEVCPGSKLLWSTDGHWYPESYYLGSLQSRQVLYDVLSELVQRDDLLEAEAVILVQAMLFHNSNRLYNLGWTPRSAPARCT